MALQLKNNAISKLASSITSGATSLSVLSGEGAKFPTLSGSDWFPVTLIKSSGALEIVRCTARSGDVLTVTRAQEGTSAQAFTAGDRVELRLTAAAIAAMQAEIDTIETDYLSKAGNLSGLASQSTSRSNLGLGNAATETIQSSVTDETAGRLMINGGHGLGNAGTASVKVLDDAKTTGFYRYQSTDPDVPEASLSGPFMVLVNSTSAIQQVAFASGTSKLWTRFWNGSVWSSWVSLYTTANVSSFMQTLLDDVDDASAKTTLGIPLAKEYISTEQTITLSGSLTLAHGMAASPKLLKLVLICKTAEHGYSVNDVVFVANEGSSSVSDSHSISASYNGTTNIDIRYGSSAPRVANKTTGAGTTITAANWKLIVRAWA